MKIVAISDTHNQLRNIKVPHGDVLIHAGDFTMNGTANEIREFNHELSLLPHAHKIVIAGNHDINFEMEPVESRKLLTNAIYLEDSGVEIGGVKFWGSPWQPQFYDWAFNLERGLPLKEKWQQIPSDTDVLITHGPPKEILDEAPRKGILNYLNVGCKNLREEVLYRIQPKYHVFGHIHNGYGYKFFGNINFINASILNERYKIENKPIIFNI